MYEAGLALLNEPGEVKEALPIAYILEQAGVQVYAGESRLQGICPFHDDHTPSLDVYRWGSGERFGCFSCGSGGDVFDLIQALWPMGFRDSVDAAKRAIVKMKEEGWVAPDLTQAPEWDALEASALLSRARASGAEGRKELTRLIDAKGWPFTAEWLQFRWEVASLRQEVLVPYWSAAGRLVAIKHRPSGGGRPLISLPGAQLKGTLYGEWKHGIYAEGPSVPVVLCEGESDTWTADYYLGRTHEVLGVPTGAGATPFWSDIFKGRHVIIAFDGDEAGQAGAYRWRDLILEYGCSTWICEVPPGLDVASLPNGALLQLVN